MLEAVFNWVRELDVKMGTPAVAFRSSAGLVLPNPAQLTTPSRPHRQTYRLRLGAVVRRD